MQAEPLEIDAQSLKARLAGDDAPVVLDVREPWEIETAAVDGALCIPLGQLTGRIGEVPKDRPVAAMCHHGARSGQATAWLRSQGYTNVMNLVGGIDAWSRLVDPAVPRY
jgi:rhodanese-related sulfurtransferase